jgi:putative selenium metabolism protein SsnA
VTLALVGGTVVAGLGRPELSQADVVLDGPSISQVGGRIPDDAAVRDCSGCLVIPGVVCAHHHLYSVLARGMPYRLDAPRNFLQILQRVWWRLDRAMDEDLVRVSALVGGLEALLSGTTTIVDHHASPNAIPGSLDLIADALEEVGIRSVLCYEVSDRDGRERAQAGIGENARFIDARRRLARGMVGAHASFTLSEETLAACVELARRSRSGIHVHVAEDAADQADAQGRFHRGVVQRLAESGALSESELLAHCVHLEQTEAAIVREAGATVAHNPRSNMNNGVGRARVSLLGDHVALGTDGIGGDMITESQTAYWRAREDDVQVTPAWALGRLSEGARFAGRAWRQPLLGRIEPGAPADVVVLDYTPPTPLTADGFAGHWIFGLSPRHVRDVIVAGEVVVDHRRPVRVDPDEILRTAAGEGARLWDRLTEIEPHDFEPAGSR